MKRVTTFLTALGVVLCLTVIPSFAQRGGHGGGPPAGGPGGGAGMGMGASESQGRSGEMGRGGTMGNNQSNMPMNNSGMRGQSASASSPTSLLSSNTKLASTLQDRLGSMLPSGMTLTDAASGFKNLGQFIAAVHVSHNLGIPFSDLKDKMASGDSLGKAIQALKPDVKAKAEAKKANRQAKTDLKETHS
jgi:hypothetical protein